MHHDVITLDNVKVDIKQINRNIPTAHHTSFSDPRGSHALSRKPVAQKPKIHFDAITLDDARQSTTKAIKMQQRTHHTSLCDPCGNQRRGRKPVAWKPKMHLDANNLDDVKGSRQTPTKPIEIQQRAHPTSLSDPRGRHRRSLLFCFSRMSTKDIIKPKHLLCAFRSITSKFPLYGHSRAPVY